MKWLAFLLVCAASAQERQSVAAFARQGNRFVSQLSDGVADLEWISPSTFRFRHTYAPQLPPRSSIDAEPVNVIVNESEAEISFTTMFLKTTLRKDDLRVNVRKAADSTTLMNDLTPAQRREGVISWERQLEPAARYYGLGAKTGASLNLRGMLVPDAIPFLLSTAGYGEQHVAPGKYVFDIGRSRPGRYRIEIRKSETIDYYFYFGPTPKEIFEERLKAVGAKFAPQSDPVRFRWLLEQSLSGIILPPEMVTRPVPSAFRKRLNPYLAAYIQEVHDRGCPILHPLAVQFPRDPETDKYPDETMLGDELLLAIGRSTYLPQGIWTNLSSNAVSPGKKVIQTEDGPAIFARNGSIVPLTGSNTLELHYFPKLGAEFFLYEEEAGDYTQTHAAPAVDVIRLEIESKVARDYTWVVHHVESVKAVAAGETQLAEVKIATDLLPKTWYYDAALQNLHVRDSIVAGQDHIVNVSF